MKVIAGLEDRMVDFAGSLEVIPKNLYLIKTESLGIRIECNT